MSDARIKRLLAELGNIKLASAIEERRRLRRSIARMQEIIMNTSMPVEVQQELLRLAQQGLGA